MNDYTLPPTDEFARKKESGLHGGAFGWLTLQKAVMNDYYFDNPTSEWVIADIDAFMHKIYYCWQEAMDILHNQMQMGLVE